MRHTFQFFIAITQMYAFFSTMKLFENTISEMHRIFSIIVLGNSAHNLLLILEITDWIFFIKKWNNKCRPLQWNIRQIKKNLVQENSVMMFKKCETVAWPCNSTFSRKNQALVRKIQVGSNATSTIIALTRHNQINFCLVH